MKTILIAAFLAIALSAVSASIASAHVLKVDGSIGAILHIPPDDNPIAGEPTTYVMTFSDDADAFNLKHCDCHLIVRDDARVVHEQAMGGGSATVSYTTLAVSRPGVYTFSFEGKPIASATFQPFRLDYTIRVSGSATDRAQPIPVLLWVGITMTIGLILLASSRIGYN